MMNLALVIDVVVDQLAQVQASSARVYERDNVHAECVVAALCL